MPLSPTDIINNHKEITHVLSIGGRSMLESSDGQCFGISNEYWDASLSLMSFDSRANLLKSQLFFLKNIYFSPSYDFCNLSPEDKSNLCFYIINLSLNELVNIDIGWKRHALCIHVVRTRNGFMMIYVNKGYSGLLANKNTVQVYRFYNPSAILHLLSSIDTDLDNREGVMVSIMNTWSCCYDRVLSSMLSVPYQKVENCTVANKFMGWHLQLIIQALKESRCSTFVEAYYVTKRHYKTMRLYDRANAVLQLINCKKNYKHESYLALLICVVTKMYLKGARFCNHLLSIVDDSNPARIIELKKDVHFLITSGSITPGSMREDALNMLTSTFEYDRSPQQRLISLATAAMFKVRSVCARLMYCSPRLALRPVVLQQTLHQNNLEENAAQISTSLSNTLL